MKTNTKSFSEETKSVLYDISDYEILQKKWVIDTQESVNETS